MGVVKRLVQLCLIVHSVTAFSLSWFQYKIPVQVGGTAFVSWKDYDYSLPVTIKLAVQNPDGSLSGLYTWDNLPTNLLPTAMLNIPESATPGINYYFVGYQNISQYATLGPFILYSQSMIEPTTSYIVSGATASIGPTASASRNTRSSSTSKSTGTPQETFSPEPQGSSLSTGAIAGIAVGGAVVVIGAIAALILLLRRKKNNKSADNQDNNNNNNNNQQQYMSMPVPQKDEFSGPDSTAIQMSQQPFMTGPEGQYTPSFLPPYSGPQQQMQQTHSYYSQQRTSNIESAHDYTTNTEASLSPQMTTSTAPYNADPLTHGKTMLPSETSSGGLTVNDPTLLLLSSMSAPNYQKPETTYQKPDEVHPNNKPHET
ncbi:hypothetical protein CU097_003862 [Rhizopus azygosporus]|uniref:Mid2 domain-containing protein n=1 Tax=Rhizopus azygosporus TaxID=86630 RepID=A0A367JVA2_RHIAZ|nr:hypothetical protein CU097_003862 [Rhizopus azygosporus]